MTPETVDGGRGALGVAVDLLQLLVKASVESDELILDLVHLGALSLSEVSQSDRLLIFVVDRQKLFLVLVQDRFQGIVPIFDLSLGKRLPLIGVHDDGGLLCVSGFCSHLNWVLSQLVLDMTVSDLDLLRHQGLRVTLRPIDTLDL